MLHAQTLLAYIFQTMLLSVVATEFSEEFHLAICTPEKGLDELEGSGLSNSKSIFNNGGNYSHPGFPWVSNYTAAVAKSNVTSSKSSFMEDTVLGKVDEKLLLSHFSLQIWDKKQRVKVFSE